MLTALVSLLTNRIVRNDLAMTGEITLRGAVLPIGGVMEKVLAAHRAGIKTVILPERNRLDLEEIPASVFGGASAIQFQFVKEMSTVLDMALAPRADGKEETSELGLEIIGVN